MMRCQHEGPKCAGPLSRHAHVEEDGAFSVELCAFHRAMWIRVEESTTYFGSHHPTVGGLTETEDERDVRVVVGERLRRRWSSPEWGYLSACGKRIFAGRITESPRWADSRHTPSCVECAITRDQQLEVGSSTLIPAQTPVELTEEEITLRVWRHVESRLQAARVVVTHPSSEAVEMAGNILERGIQELISAGEIPTCRLVDVRQRPLASGNAFIAFDIKR